MQQQPDAPKFSLIATIIGRAGTDDEGFVPDLPMQNGAGPGTRRGYAWSLRWVLRFALNLKTDAEVEALDAGVLVKATVRAFFDKVSAQAARIDDQTRRNTFLRTAYGYYENSTFLFTFRPLEAMRTTFGLVLPDMADWRAGRKTYGQHVPAPATAAPPADAIVFNTIREWLKMGRTPGYSFPGADRKWQRGVKGKDLPMAPLSETDRRNVFIAIGLELSCGLRVSETKRVKGSWFQQESTGMPVLRSGATAAKNGTGHIEVTPVDPFWRRLQETMRRNNWQVAAADHVLYARPLINHRPLFRTGGVSDRNFWPAMLGSRWLRWLGWTTQKSNHALRDYVASMITMRYGLGDASLWCRHGQLSTTQTHYNRFVRLAKRVNPNKLAWLRWAR